MSWETVRAMSVLRIAWRLDGSGLVQSMLATMAGSDVARNDRGMHTLGSSNPISPRASLCRPSRRGEIA
ncbi:Uncharacterised protein [Mycobacteroides abscessus subsp. abscessus]|nr:Uncharacterised protein [Mycobacteroides abscessus subsp. abscessus]